MDQCYGFTAKNFWGIFGIIEISVPTFLINRVKSQLPRLPAKSPLDYNEMLHRLGRRVSYHRENLRESDCEYRLQVIRIQCTVATFPPI